MTKTSKITLAVLGVIIVALVGGYLGAGLHGGSPAAAAAGGSGEATFLQKIKDRGELRVGVALAPPMTAQQADGSLGGPNLIPLQELAEELGVRPTGATSSPACRSTGTTSPPISTPPSSVRWRSSSPTRCTSTRACS